MPHLMPLVSFVTLMLLIDNFRVFELSSALLPRPTPPRLVGSSITTYAKVAILSIVPAGATSVLTVIGVMILMTPVLIRTWRAFNRKV